MTYASTASDDTEHIWERRLSKSLQRALCGKLSDGGGFRYLDDPPRCELCEVVRKKLEELRLGRVSRWDADTEYHRRRRAKRELERKGCTMTESYDLGWMVMNGMTVAHFFRTNDLSKAAVSHCGAMFPKDKLERIVNVPRCRYCQVVQDRKDRSTEVVRSLDVSCKP